VFTDEFAGGRNKCGIPERDNRMEMIALFAGGFCPFEEDVMPRG
jgi:hypothetical protein